MTNVGILSMERIGVQTFYSANKRSPIFSELKSIAEKTFGLVDILNDVLRDKGGDISIAFVYGSVAAADDTGSSDIDLMVIGKLSFRNLVAMLKPVEDAIHRPINPTLYTEEEFSKKLSDGNNFLRGVMKYEKLFILGTEDDLAGLV